MREVTPLVLVKEAKAQIQDQGIKAVTVENEEKKVGRSTGLRVEVGRNKGLGVEVGIGKRGRETGLRREKTGVGLERVKNLGNIPMMTN